LIKILHVRIQNLLSFQREAIVKNAYPISVFVGPNNAGKSNLVRSMLLYKNLLLDYKNKRETYSIKSDYYHQLARNEISTISIRYKFEDRNFSNHSLEIDHFILFNYQGYFDRERFSLRKENGEEIGVMKKENSKSYVNSKELVGDFLFGTKSGYSVSSPEVGFQEVPIGFHVPFFWPENDDSPGIRIYNEIKKYIENWVFILPDRLIRMNESEKTIRDRLSSQRKIYNKLIGEINRITGVLDINLSGANSEITTYVSDGPDITVKLANLGSGFHQIYIMYPQFFEGLVDRTTFFIEEQKKYCTTFHIFGY